MASLPYMQLYVADYLADTAHLTAAQHGAYLLLLFNYWQRGKPLNNSNERLTNVARMSSEEWAEAKPVLSEFFTIDGDEWIHDRIERDLDAVAKKSSKASDSGRVSAAKKRNGRSTNVQRSFNERSTDGENECCLEDKNSSDESEKVAFIGQIPDQIDMELVTVCSGDAETASSVMAVESGKFNERSTIVQRTFNHKDKDKDKDKDININTYVVSELTPCPHHEIISIYAERLPQLPQVRKWEGTRQKHLKARWAWVLKDLKARGKPFDKEAGLDFFGRMFSYIGKSDFLMGRSTSWSCPGLPWIVNDENFTKIIEGNYENKEV